MNAPAEHWNDQATEHADGGGRSSVKRLLEVALGILVSLVLLAAGGFFWIEIQRDEAVTAQHMRAVESIRATQVLAEQWSVEVGKVKEGINSNFDVLAEFADRIAPHVRMIHDSQNAMPDLPSTIRWAMNGYVQRLKAREERIERFKSGFAIVRNSRTFIPREGALLVEAARDGGHRRAEAATRQIMERTQEFLRQPTEDQYQWLVQATRSLAESAAGTALHTQAESLNKHVDALLQHYSLTEQRFADVMHTDLEGRAERVIGLLDANHQQGRTNRRYFDYGFWGSLGLVLFYWATLIVRWMGRRRKERAAARTPEAVPAAGFPSPLDMDGALAAAGGPGFPMEDAQGSGRAGEGERPQQSRQAPVAQYPGRRTGAAPTLEERLKARGQGGRRTQHEDVGGEAVGGETVGREDAQERGAGREIPAGWEAPARGEKGTPGGGPEEEPSLKERLKALKAELEARKRAQAQEAARRAQHEGSMPEDAGRQGVAVPESATEDDRTAPADGEEAPSAAGRADLSLEERLAALNAERGDPAGTASPGWPRRDGPTDTALEGFMPEGAPEQGVGVSEGERVRAQVDGAPVRLPAIARDDAWGAGPIRADGESPLAQDRARAAEPGTEQVTAVRVRAEVPAVEVPRVEAPVAEAPAIETPRTEAPRAEAPRAEAPAAGAAERSGGGTLRLQGREAEEAPLPSQPDGSEFIHRATQEAVLDRLREIELEIRAAADAAEQAVEVRSDADGEERHEDQEAAWTAAAGRMAGARWAVHTLLQEVDRLPVASPLRGPQGRVDMKVLLDRQLDALAEDDRKRIDATLVPGAVARGNPQVLETAADLIVQHALEGARLHPDDAGYVVMTLMQEDDGVHLTCLDHGPEGKGSGERRSLSLAVARGLIEGQGGEMEITPYPLHGTMVRLRLPPAR